MHRSEKRIQGLIKGIIFGTRGVGKSEAYFVNKKQQNNLLLLPLKPLLNKVTYTMIGKKDDDFKSIKVCQTLFML